ncbi:MAG: hypothetical protein FJW20_18505 [Acidimicrobiia bacterium]|nr:hypothetical protein [Acidimicrobiia bacterium]
MCIRRACNRIRRWRCLSTGESGIQDSSPVSKYAGGKSPYGCHDMSGNVREWIGGGGEYRELRGGSWCNFQRDAACAYRGSILPAYRGGSIGFRCSRTF